MRLVGILFILATAQVACLSLSSSSGEKGGSADLPFLQSANDASRQQYNATAGGLLQESVVAAAPAGAPPQPTNADQHVPSYVTNPGGSVIPVVSHYKEAMYGYDQDSPLYEVQEAKRVAHHKRAVSGTHSAATLSYAQCLIGFLIFVMCLFYLVNSSDMQVRFYTWMKINVTMSVFLSLVIYRLLQEAFIDLAFYMEIYVNKPLWGCIFFSILLITLQIVTHQLRNYKKSRTMLAVSTIGAHLVAFSALYGFAALQATPPFNSSAILALVVGIIASVIFLIVVAISTAARQSFADDDGVVDKNEAAWMCEAESTENDAMSICIGFLTMQAVRFWIVGSLQPYGALDTPMGITQWQTHMLFLASFVFFFLTGTWTVLMVYIRWMLPKPMKRLCMLLQNTFVMTWAYCLLFWGEWQVYLWGFHAERIAMCMLVALVLTAFSLLHILFINVIHKALPEGMGGHKSLWSIVLAFGVLVGFAWERVFDIAMDSFEEDMTINNVMNANLAHWFCKRALPILLCCLFLPAWWLYILARHHEHREAHEAPKQVGVPPKTHMQHPSMQQRSYQQHPSLGGLVPPATMAPQYRPPVSHSAPPEHFQPINSHPAPAGYGSVGGGYGSRGPAPRPYPVSSSLQPDY